MDGLGEQMQLMGAAGQGSNDADNDGDIMLMDEEEELKESHEQ